MNEIPNVVRVPYKIDEPVIDFIRRVLMKAAEESGLPLLEQRIFADAMLAQYPDTAKRSWENDVTPSDKNAKLQSSDFTFLLYQRLLNENPSIRAAARPAERFKSENSNQLKEKFFPTVR